MWLLAAARTLFNRYQSSAGSSGSARPQVEPLEVSKCLIDWRTGAATFLADDGTPVSRPCPADIPQ